MLGHEQQDEENTDAKIVLNEGEWKQYLAAYNAKLNELQSESISRCKPLLTRFIVREGTTKSKPQGSSPQNGTQVSGEEAETLPNIRGVIKAKLADMKLAKILAFGQQDPED
jgi:hypothetical protein